MLVKNHIFFSHKNTIYWAIFPRKLKRFLPFLLYAILHQEGERDYVKNGAGESDEGYGVGDSADVGGKR